MPLVDLPFLQGQDAKTDTKIAPLGVLKSAKNVRIQRDGRLVKRTGFTTQLVQSWLGASINSDIQALAARGEERVMIAGNRLYSYAYNTLRWRDWGILPEVGAPERRESGRNKNASCIDPSIAVQGTTINGNFTAQNICTVFAANGEIFSIVHDGYTGATRSSAKVSTVTSGQSTPRIIALGTTFVCTWLDTTTNQLYFSTYDTTATNATWAAPTVLHNTVYNGHTFYDVSVWSSTQYLVTWQRSVGIISIGYANASGLVARADIAANGRPTCCGAVGENTSCVWFDTATNNVHIQTFTSSGTNPINLIAAADTTIAAGWTTTRAPLTVARKNSTTHTVVVGRNDATAGNSGDGLGIFDVTTATAASTSFSWNGIRPASKLYYRSGKLWLLGVNESNFERVYCLISMTDFTDAALQTTIARGEAISYTAGQSQNLSEVVEAVVGGPGNPLSLLFAFPYISSGSVATSASPHLSSDYAVVPFRVASSERYQSAEYGGCTYLTGGLLSMFDGQLAHEVGFQTAQSIISLASSNAGGSMTSNGVYQYVLTREWYDAQGGRHISGVSDIQSVTLGATHNRVVVTWNPNIQSNRGARWISGGYNSILFYVRTHVWRTLNGGSTFYRVTPEEGLPRPIGSLADTLQTFTDTSADASISTNPVLYTQGIRGGLSGPLQHDPPPPCKYIWLGKSRGIIGGLEHPDEVRWTKFFYPGEPLEFSEDFGFRRRVSGKRVTGVASLDGSWIVFTSDQIFAFFGDGPDDSGSGEFTDPQALPSEVGCIEARSIIETPLGLMFQARADAIYLLPRGLSSPQWIGFPVRDVLSALGDNCRITGVQMLKEQNVVVFSAWDGTGTAGTMLVFDLRSGKWSEDPIYSGTINGSAGWVGMAQWVRDRSVAYRGGTQLAIANQTDLCIQSSPDFSPTYTDGGQWYGVTIETQALRPGGMQSAARTRKLSALAEYRGACSLQYELAADDATTFTSSVQWAVTGLSVGDPVRREWRIPNQKMGAFRFRITEQQNGASTAGLAFTGLTFETQQRAGMPRLREGYRG